MKDQVVSASALVCCLLLVATCLECLLVKFTMYQLLKPTFMSPPCHFKQYSLLIFFSPCRFKLYSLVIRILYFISIGSTLKIPSVLISSFHCLVTNYFPIVCTQLSSIEQEFYALLTTCMVDYGTCNVIHVLLLRHFPR